MKFWAPFQIQTVRDIEDLRRFVDQGMKNISQLVTKNVNFTDNIQCTIVPCVTLGTTEIAVPHTLGTVPFGYLVLSRGSTAVVYDGSSAWNDKNIYLRATGTVGVKLAILGG